jgi:hypothetical protein
MLEFSLSKSYKAKKDIGHHLNQRYGKGEDLYFTVRTKFYIYSEYYRTYGLTGP